MKLFKKKSDKKIVEPSFINNGHEIISATESSLNSELYYDAKAAEAAGLALTGQRTSVLFFSHNNIHHLDLNGFNHSPLVVHVHSEWTEIEKLLYDQKHIVIYCPLINELAHLTILAHKISEVLLEPVFLIHEADLESSYARVTLPDFKSANTFLGNPNDQIDSLTNQIMLFGEKRRRIPQWIDYGRAMGLNPVYNASIGFKTHIAKETFTSPAKLGEINKIFESYNSASGQTLNLLFNSNTDKANQIYYGTGQPIIEIASFLDKSGSSVKKHNGTIIPVLLSPFPIDQFQELTKSKKKILIKNYSLGYDLNKIIKVDANYECVVDETQFGYNQASKLTELAEKNNLNRITYLVNQN